MNLPFPHAYGDFSPQAWGICPTGMGKKPHCGGEILFPLPSISFLLGNLYRSLFLLKCGPALKIKKKVDKTVRQAPNR